jgi:hypothetical protein
LIREEHIDVGSDAPTERDFPCRLEHRDFVASRMNRPIDRVENESQRRQLPSTRRAMLDNVKQSRRLVAWPLHDHGS